jgi:hypothetical protein
MTSDESKLPIYDPPYDSPIEERFAWVCAKWLRTGVKFEKQVPLETPWGKFRIDFVITSLDGRRIAVECDGRDFHDPARDRWRDAIILGEAMVDVIWRFTGADLHYVAEDCVFVLSTHEPGIFSERGVVNLRLLATDEARQACDPYELAEREFDSGGTLMIYRRPDAENDAPPISRIGFRRRDGVGWRLVQHLYAFARDTGRCRLDELIAKYEAKLKRSGKWLGGQ